MYVISFSFIFFLVIYFLFSLDIAKQKEEFEKEVLLLKAKLMKAEASVHTLQGQLAVEQQEKKEVMGICDELVRKLQEVKK